MARYRNWKRFAALTFGTLALAGWLAGCGVDSSPVATDVEQSDADAGSTLLTFSLGKPQPAAKVLGGDKEQKKAEREKKKAERQAAQKKKQEERQAEREQKQEERQAAREQKQEERQAAQEQKKAEREKKQEERRKKADERAFERSRIQGDYIGPKGGIITVGHEFGPGASDDLVVDFVVPERALDEPTRIKVTLHGDRLENLAIEFAPAGLVFNTPAELWIKIGKGRVHSSDLEDLLILHQYEDGKVEEYGVEVDEEEEKYWLLIKVPGFSRYSMGGGE